MIFITSGYLGFFYNKKTIVLVLMQKSKLFGIVVVTSSIREQSIMSNLRLDDKQFNQKLFWSVVLRD